MDQTEIHTCEETGEGPSPWGGQMAADASGNISSHVTPIESVWKSVGPGASSDGALVDLQVLLDRVQDQPD